MRVDAQIRNIGMMDRLATGQSPIHRLDPRAKLIVVISFLICVVSFGKYELSALVPFALFPLCLASAAGIPFRIIWIRILPALPFAVFAGMANPLIDREPLVWVGSVGIAGGWISFLSILLRVGLCVSMAIVLLASTGIHGICFAFDRLGAPQVFTTQLLFMHRYIFLLAEEGLRMMRARAVRSCGNRGMGMAVYGSMIGHLLIRTLDRAQRIYSAMRCRGFSGHLQPIVIRRFQGSDWLFVLGGSLLAIVLRRFNISFWIGEWLTGGIS